MRLISFYIENFKIFDKFFIKFDRHVILCGNFATGKTCLLQAINYAKKIATDTLTDSEQKTLLNSWNKFDSSNSQKETIFEFYYELNNKKFLYTLKFDRQSNSITEIFFDKEQDRKTKYNGDCIFCENSVRNFFDKLFVIFDSFAMKDCVCCFTIDEVNEKRYFEHCGLGKIFLNIGRNTNKPCVSIPNRALILKGRQAFVNVKGELHELVFTEFNPGKRTSLYEDQCSGVRKLLDLMPLLIKKDSVIFADNFDDGLHPVLAHRICNQINTSRNQTICVSKNENVFDFYSSCEFISFTKFRNKIFANQIGTSCFSSKCCYFL